MSILSSNVPLSLRDDADPNNPYGYIPTLWVCATFIALFSLSTLIHVGQAIHFRMWWLFPTVCLAGIGEIIGWSARLWSSKNVDLQTPYLMQITTTIIAPTPLVAANFVILGRLIPRLGDRYSRLSGKWYLIIFSVADLVALTVQAVGGATASSSSGNDNNATTGGRIMLGGIIFQLVAITIYVVLASEFVFRYLRNKPIRGGNNDFVENGRYLDRPTFRMLCGLAFSSLVIYIRSIYRTIELADGWHGVIIRTQVYFNVLDGAMIVLAIYCINVFHPGFLFGRNVSAKSDSDMSETSTKNEVIVGIKAV